jgi:hypothetical protein
VSAGPRGVEPKRAGAESLPGGERQLGSGGFTCSLTSTFFITINGIMPSNGTRNVAICQQVMANE